MSLYQGVLGLKCITFRIGMVVVEIMDLNLRAWGLEEAGISITSGGSQACVVPWAFGYVSVHRTEMPGVPSEVSL